METKDRLRKLRKEAHLTQVKLGQKLGYGYTAIANYESGRNNPSIKDLQRLADIFNTSLDYLTGYTDERYDVSWLSQNETKMIEEMQQKNPELNFMDKMIFLFLYRSLLGKKCNEQNINEKIEEVEHECYTMFSESFYHFMKNDEIKKMIASQLLRP